MRNRKAVYRAYALRDGTGQRHGCIEIWIRMGNYSKFIFTVCCKVVIDNYYAGHEHSKCISSVWCLYVCQSVWHNSAQLGGRRVASNSGRKHAN